MVEAAKTLGGIIVIHHRDAKDVFKAVRAVLVKEHANSMEFSNEKITELSLKDDFDRRVLAKQQRRVEQVKANIAFCAGLIEDIEGLPMEVRRQKTK